MALGEAVVAKFKAEIKSTHRYFSFTNFPLSLTPHESGNPFAGQASVPFERFFFQTSLGKARIEAEV